ncbi:MAG: DUF6064 family protein, partial [Pseudolabrys sp.]
MSVWLTYSLSDFLLFSPRTYYRLFELYNRAVWPAHGPAGALGIALIVLLRGGGAWRGRAIAGILALLWLWVAWAYLFERYATINWAASYFAAAFAVQAFLLVVSGLVLNRLTPGADAPSRAGIVILASALIVQPLLAPLLGRGWITAEVFGIAPDPTVVGTLGALLAAARVPWHLLVVPLLWCAVSGATLWAMDAPDALLMPAVAVVAIGIAGWKAFTGRGPAR